MIYCTKYLPHPGGLLSQELYQCLHYLPGLLDCGRQLHFRSLSTTPRLKAHFYPQRRQKSIQGSVKGNSWTELWTWNSTIDWGHHCCNFSYEIPQKSKASRHWSVYPKSFDNFDRFRSSLHGSSTSLGHTTQE